MRIRTFNHGDIMKGGRTTQCEFEDQEDFRRYIRRQAKRGAVLRNVVYDMRRDEYQIEFNVKPEACCLNCTEYKVGYSNDMPYGTCSIMNILGHDIVNPLTEVCSYHRRS